MKKLFFTFGIVTFCLHFLAGEEDTIKILYNATQREDLNANPFVELEKAIQKAKNKGVAHPHVGILASTDQNCRPYTRRLGISKITPEGIVFYTDPKSGKWQQFKENNKVSFTLYSHEYESPLCVTINGFVDLKEEVMGKRHKLIVNGVKSEFEWKEFVLIPTEFVFYGNIPATNATPYRVTDSYSYQKNEKGNWVISESVKYYVIPEETNMFPLEKVQSNQKKKTN